MKGGKPNLHPAFGIRYMYDIRGDCFRNLVLRGRCGYGQLFFYFGGKFGGCFGYNFDIYIWPLNLLYFNILSTIKSAVSFVAIFSMILIVRFLSALTPLLYERHGETISKMHTNAFLVFTAASGRNKLLIIRASHEVRATNRYWLRHFVVWGLVESEPPAGRIAPDIM